MEKRFRITLELTAETMSEAWAKAVSFVPANFTPGEGERVSENGVTRFQLDELARSFEGNFNEKENNNGRA